MPKKKTPLLTRLELELMQIIWKGEDVSVEFLKDQLAKNGHPLALPSIRTMLSILRKKGFIERHAVGRAYAYNASIPADKFQRSYLRDLMTQAFEGSAIGLVTALLNRELVNKEELGEIKKMISDYEEGENK